MTALSGATYTAITSIANDGDMVATSGTFAPITSTACKVCENHVHGFIFHDGSWIDLGNLPGHAGTVSPTAVNNHRQVVGDVAVDGANHAFLWDKGRMTDITPSSEVIAYASALNDQGVVLVDAISAYLYDHGVYTNLTQLANFTSLGWTQVAALKINNAGQIVGTAFAPDSSKHSFVLTPTPQ